VQSDLGQNAKQQEIYYEKLRRQYQKDQTRREQATVERNIPLASSRRSTNQQAGGLRGSARGKPLPVSDLHIAA
jgi:hypothetical protein